MRIATDIGRRALARCLVAVVGVSVRPAPPASAAGGPSSLSGKPRPETGVLLLDAAVQSGQTISAELLCTSSSTSNSIVAQAAFESAYPIAKGNYYDVEARNKEGDAAFIHVATLPAGQTLERVPPTFFTDTALGTKGRFGSYSAPLIKSVGAGGKSAAAPKAGATRFVDVSFSALTQAGYEVPRRGVIAALQPAGSSDVLMLVSTVSAARWKKGGEADARFAAESFRVVQARPSQLQPLLDNDYRYNARSINRINSEVTEIEAALARELSTQSGELSGKFKAAATGVVGYAPK